MAAHSTVSPFAIDVTPVRRTLTQASEEPALKAISTTFWRTSWLSRSTAHCHVARAVAPAVSMFCSERTFVDAQARLDASALDSLALYGLPSVEVDSLSAFKEVSSLLPGIPCPTGIVGESAYDQLPVSTMHFPDPERLIFDSAKLARLDSLLQELKAGGHRALIYFQMTKMIDLMEEYLVYRQYKYLRLDGDSKIEDRRDMVSDWQNRYALSVSPPQSI